MREKLKAKRELSKKHIDKKLMRRLLIHFGISVIMLGVMIYEMIISSIERRRPAIAIAMGFAIGSVTHRIFLIYRHEDEQKVLSRIDRTGWVILVIYILFSIFRKQLIEQFFNGPAVLAITMALVFGLMAGRVVGTRNKIKKILREQEIIK